MSSGTIKIDWEKFITVDSGWVSKHLLEHTPKSGAKLMLRIYSLQFSGQHYESAAFVKFIINSIKNYVLTKKELAELEKNGDDPFMQARDHFGDVDPIKDGKYGELMLYLLTEAVLKVPLIAYKMPTNPNDQVKGGDGFFCGDYQNSPAILIGEAKTWQGLNRAFGDAFESLNKLYDGSNPTPANYEYFVAGRNLRADLSSEELDYLLNCLRPGTDEYKVRNKVHPVLIVYDEKSISEISAENNTDGDDKLKKFFESKIDKYEILLQKHISQNSAVAASSLDFFLIPVTSVKEFKLALYKQLHGAAWRPKEQDKGDGKKKAKAKKGVKMKNAVTKAGKRA